MTIPIWHISLVRRVDRSHHDTTDVVRFRRLVYDHLPVDSIDFKQNNTCLALRIGQVLKENDILIYIYSDREPNPLELVVDKNQTLSHLWLLIKDELRMDGSIVDWWRRSSSCLRFDVCFRKGQRLSFM
jgi:hypothetical protein